MIKQLRPDCATLLGRAIASEPLAFSRALLSAAISDNFVDWFKDEISHMAGIAVHNLVDDGEEPRMPDEEFTEMSFCDAPKAEMKKMREIWRDLTPREASSPAVWTYINLRMIEHGLVKPWFFVNPHRGSKQASGKILAEKILCEGSEDDIKKCARSVSRFLTGYVPERSSRPLYSNCPPSRAWWMWHLAEQAAQAEILPEVDADHVFGILHEKWAWAELTEAIVSQLTVIGDVNIRHGVLRFFLLPDEQETQEWLRRSKSFRSLLVGVGEMSAWRALGFFGPERIADILKEEIAPNIVVTLPETDDEENESGDEGEI